MPKGVKALWNYGQTELDLESHSCIVSKHIAKLNCFWKIVVSN